MERKFNDQETVRREKLSKLCREMGSPYHITRLDELLSINEILNLPEGYNLPLRCAGRILVVRHTFFVLSEHNTRIQAYIDLKGNISETNKEEKEKLYSYFKEYIDIGDYVYILGTLFRTKTGELTVNVSDLKIVSKALKPLPNKRDGIVDPELTVRNRVAHIITSPECFNVLEARSKIIQSLREFLYSKDYLEVETPILHKIAGGAAAKPFITRHNVLKEDLFLRVAPELYLKRLIVGGFTKVFEIGKSFRNEGVDSTHNPEFTSVEIYTAYEDMFSTMQLCENLLTSLFKKFMSSPPIAFKRFHIADLIREKYSVNFREKVPSKEETFELAKKFSLQIEEEEISVGLVYEKIFEDLISPELVEPTFVFGFSSEQSPLAKKDRENPFFSERFELYVDGQELANGFSEQNDPSEQERQFREQLGQKNSTGSIDYDYISSLEYGLPPTGGVGIGIDRLVMYILGRKNIKEVITFPFLKG
ncbi:lysyl-tRNA synthetase [Plasmodium vivax North Korean]|uniref:Lysine--tRNA ligase n=1 Tax=Plasmodium vivax North Korean TaxID=1035514 RepID=A0A0J9TLZ8_PLAVI|nr:lysyl-tRNA synthetase [Plasmodium vivax North Korean]